MKKLMMMIRCAMLMPEILERLHKTQHDCAHEGWTDDWAALNRLTNAIENGTVEKYREYELLRNAGVLPCSRRDFK